MGRDFSYLLLSGYYQVIMQVGWSRDPFK